MAWSEERDIGNGGTLPFGLGAKDDQAGTVPNPDPTARTSRGLLRWPEGRMDPCPERVGLN
jgi:hypothetical protein